MNRSELKAKAKAQIKGKIGVLFVISLIISLISGVSGVLLARVPGGSMVASIIITPAFSLSLIRVYLMLFGDKKPTVNDAFSGFDDFWSAFKVTFLVSLFTFLWSLLFIIPGIIKGFSYSMSMYILAENKGKPALECIKESQAMTEGHKAELFILYMSFVGWALLGVFTLGIAYIWVLPYMSATFANAYESLKPVVESPVDAVLDSLVENPEPTEESTDSTENTDSETIVGVKPGITLKLKQTDFRLTVYYEHQLLLDCGLEQHEVEWRSEHPHIATVDKDGVVKAIKDGTTSIIAKYGDQEVSCIVRCIY